MTAFRATYADMKLIKTRQVVQIIFEVPQKDFDAAYEVLGGLPNPAAERWFGIAAIDVSAVAQPRQSEGGKSTAGAKRDWRELSPAQQAGIRCDESTFSAFLKEQRPDDWHEAQDDPAECVRLICGVKSRSDLATNHTARVMWHQLEAYYQTWLMAERVGA